MTCSECGRGASRLRKERCNACYMRLYRNGEIPVGASCACCAERRRQFLVHAELAGGEICLCGNCSLVLARTRLRAESLDELKLRVARERRRAVVAVGGGTARRRADRIFAAPALDPSID